MEKIGALWIRKTTKGADYFNGSINIQGKEYKIAIFKNGYKKENKHPDYVVNLLEAQQQKPTAINTPTEQMFDDDDENIPF